MEADPKWYQSVWIIFSTLNTQQGLLIANFVLVIVTIVYVFITRNYSYHTKRMADIMYKDFELRITPQYEVMPTIEMHTEEYIHGVVRIKNKGLNKIYVRNIEIFLISIEPNSLNSQYSSNYEGVEDKLTPDKGSIYTFHIVKSEHASQHFISREPFFGVVCNVLFRAQIAGPDLDYKKVSITII